jgi:hypothetical protein
MHLSGFFSLVFGKNGKFNKSTRRQGGGNQRVLLPKEETLKGVQKEVLNPKCHRYYSIQSVEIWQ